MVSTAAERARRSASRTSDTSSALHSAIFRDAAPEPAAAPEQRPSVEDVAAQAAASREGATKRVRKTLDLPRARYHALNRWQAETADELDLVEVSGQAVLETLVGLLLTDEVLARKVRAELRRTLAGS